MTLPRGVPPQKSRLKFSIRWFMLFTGLAALLMFFVVQAVRPGPPAIVLQAVQKQVPGMIVETIRPETFGGEPAWEIVGTDRTGERWMLDVGSNGAMLMYEKNP